MATTRQIADEINEVLTIAQNALDAAESTGYQQLSYRTSKLDDLARETFQETVRGPALSLVEKLDAGQSLTEAEHDLLKLLIVGAAEYYLDTENNVEVWQAETRRLMTEMKDLLEKGLDNPDALLQLRALCRDASRVVPDLVYYYREQERLRNFERSTGKEINPEAASILAQTIQEMLDSDTM